MPLQSEDLLHATATVSVTETVSLPGLRAPALRSAPLAQPKPFIKWVGGKRRLLDDLLVEIPENFSRYHEPFVGGGALFFSLARKVEKKGRWATLSDANQRLVRTFRAVRDEVDLVVMKLREYARGHSQEHFYAVRAMNVDAMDDVETAAWFIYLNKTAFNGLYRVNRKGGFNVPIGRYANPRICDEPALRIASWALQGAEIHHEDFGTVADRADAGDVVYFDPPYVPASDSANFTSYTRDGFTMADQTRLRDVASDLKMRDVQVMLSNSDTPEVRDLYRQGFDHKRVLCGRAINCKGGKRGRVGELVIT